jgi:hypothetical protein
MATWLPPNYLRPPDEDYPGHAIHAHLFNGHLKAPSRPHTPQMRNRNIGDGSQSGHAAEGDASAEDDPLVVKFKELYNASEAKIARLFGSTGEVIVPEKIVQLEVPTAEATANGSGHSQLSAATSKKRKIDDDDYDDFDDDEDEEETEENVSPLKGRSSKVQIVADSASSQYQDLSCNQCHLRRPPKRARGPQSSHKRKRQRMRAKNWRSRSAQRLKMSSAHPG